MTRTIYTDLGAVEPVSTTFTVDRDISNATVELAVGTYDRPGEWLPPAEISFTADGRTCTAALRIGNSYVNPPPDRYYYLWYRVTDTPDILIAPTRDAEDFEVAATSGDPLVTQRPFPPVSSIAPDPLVCPVWFDTSAGTPLLRYWDGAQWAAYEGGASVPGGGDTTSGYDLWLLMGQSNVTGQATGYNSSNDPSSPRVTTFNCTGSNANVISVAADPLAHPIQTDAAGPALMFGQWMAGSIASTRKVLLVPAAVDGTAFASGTQRWKVTAADDGNNLFENAMRRAQAALAAAGANSRIAGVIWLQGESDALSGGIAANAYQASLLELIDATRTRLGNTSLPFIVGQMLYEFRQSGSTAATVDAVHQSIGGLRAYTAFAPGPGAGYSIGDNLHYNLAGQTVMGRSFFDAVAVAVANTTGSVTPPPTPAAPTQVTGLSATTGPQRVGLTWTIPSSGSAPITDYVVEFALSGSGSWSTFADGASSAASATVTGLTAGTAYDFRVSAVNSVGTGPASVTVTATAGSSASVPGAVTGLVATAGPGQAGLSWSAPVSNGGATIADYLVQYRVTSVGGAWSTFAHGASTGTTAVVTGLTNGAQYDFRVAAINSVGTGSFSATATTTPSATLPNAVIADDFNRADSATVGSTPTGSVSPAGASSASILNNKLRTVTQTTTLTWAVGTADYTYQITAVNPLTDYLVFRYAAGVGFYYWSPDGSLRKFPGSVVSSAIGPNSSYGAGDVLKVKCAGNALTFYKNGAQVGVITDSSNPTGDAGIGTANAGSDWDDMSISTP